MIDPEPARVAHVGPDQLDKTLVALGPQRVRMEWRQPPILSGRIVDVGRRSHLCPATTARGIDPGFGARLIGADGQIPVKADSHATLSGLARRRGQLRSAIHCCQAMNSMLSSCSCANRATAVEAASRNSAGQSRQSARLAVREKCSRSARNRQLCSNALAALVRQGRKACHCSSRGRATGCESRCNADQLQFRDGGVVD